MAEEALYGNNARVLEDWVGRQPPWSDQPFVVLTNRNEGEPIKLVDSLAQRMLAGR